MTRYKTEIMGILNITPDSFYDGGRYFNLREALRRAEQLVSEGADIIDVGGESTRPGSRPIKPEEEVSRVIPVVKEIKKKFPSVKISVDSYKYEVIEKALDSGVDIVNDIYALRYSSEVVNLLKKFPSTKVIIMHMKGTPENMQVNPYYDDVVDEIKSFFCERVNFLENCGISLSRVIIDPGIGFGKTTQHNLEILRKIKEFGCIADRKFPVLVGLSMKSFIGRVLGSEENPLPVEKRFTGTVILHTYLLLKKVDIIRSHDISHIVEAKKILSKLD